MSNIITFKVIDPDAQSGEWGSYEDPSCYIGLTEDSNDIDHIMRGDDIVINKPDIRVVFSYPLEKKHIITLVPTNGQKVFTRKELARVIVLKYQEIYAEEDESTEIIPETHANKNLRENGLHAGLLNRVTTNGKWGVWGHSLDDLLLHTVRYVEEEDLYTLGIDS